MNKQSIAFYVREDSPAGDVTSQAIFGSKPHRVKVKILAKEDIVVSGFSAVREILKNFKKITLKIYKNDGMFVKNGTVIAELTGPVTDLLLVERTLLNFLQRLSGIATLTQRFVHRAHLARQLQLKILDTRKTTPGLRALEKKAVRDGGGTNHRMNLSDQYLIKDNHIDAAGSVTQALLQVFAHKRRTKNKKLVEVEVRSPAEFLEALILMPDIIMLDNMSVTTIKKMVALRDKICGKHQRPFLEISGGVTLQNMVRYLKLGVERISVGALTHSARAVDISMKIKTT